MKKLGRVEKTLIINNGFMTDDVDMMEKVNAILEGKKTISHLYDGWYLETEVLDTKKLAIFVRNNKNSRSKMKRLLNASCFFFVARKCYEEVMHAFKEERAVDMSLFDALEKEEIEEFNQRKKLIENFNKLK